MYQDASAKRLRIDSAEHVAKIQKLQEDKVKLKANEDDLKTALKNEKRVSQEYKDDAEAIRIKYANSEDKVKRRGGIIIGSVCLNITLIGIGAGIIFLK